MCTGQTTGGGDEHVFPNRRRVTTRFDQRLVSGSRAGPDIWMPGHGREGGSNYSQKKLHPRILGKQMIIPRVVVGNWEDAEKT
eukprot:15653988-Heterocapsa_arctica.AAC.1